VVRLYVCITKEDIKSATGSSHDFRKFLKRQNCTNELTNFLLEKNCTVTKTSWDQVKVTAGHLSSACFLWSAIGGYHQKMSKTFFQGKFHEGTFLVFLKVSGIKNHT